MRRGCLSWLPFCFMVLIAIGCGSDAAGEVVEDQAISSNELTVDDVVLSWETMTDEVQISISAPTTGWVAVGFEPTAAMKDADIIIGYISGGDVFIRDDWGDGFTTHSPDTQLGGEDNVTLLSGAEENGRTELLFSIPLSSTDEFDKELVSGQSFEVILAYGRDDDDSYDGYHVWAKKVEVEL